MRIINLLVLFKTKIGSFAEKLKGNTNLICAALLVKSEALIKLSDFHGAKQVLLKAYKLKTPNIKEMKIIERNLRIGN